MNELALFAGAGGGILGAKLLGWRTVCAVEIEPFCREVLMRRQQDGCIPWFPIWDDVRTFDGKPWRGKVDVVSGGFPCQDISVSGKGDGIRGKRSGLWFQMERIVGEVRPSYVLVENSPALIVRGIDRVLGSLAEMGYGARWGVIGANSIGACHARERIWILAFNPNQIGRHEAQISSETFDKKESCRRQFARAVGALVSKESHSNMLRDNALLAEWVDRSSAIGNGQVPPVVKLAWEILSAEKK